jgi:hydrogenase expression/formation protein HypD
MKHLTEYRDPELAKKVLHEIEKITTKPWNIMEICGGQTHSLVKKRYSHRFTRTHQYVARPGMSGVRDAFAFDRQSNLSRVGEKSNPM